MVNVLLQGPESECEYGSKVMDVGAGADYLKLLKSVASIWVNGEQVVYNDDALNINSDGSLFLNVYTKTL